MAISDFLKRKALDVADVSDTPTISRTMCLKITSGDDSTTGPGEIVLDWTNIASEADIGVYDEDDNLLDYYFESFDSTDETAVIWIYRAWVQDGSTQLQIAYGDGPSDQSAADPSTVFSNETDLEAGYLFNETSGDLIDVSGNGNHGTVYGATRGEDGIVGGAYSLDGNDDYVKISINGSLDIKTLLFTIQLPADEDLQHDYNYLFDLRTDNDSWMYFDSSDFDRYGVSNVYVNEDSITNSSEIPRYEWINFILELDSNYQNSNELYLFTRYSIDNRQLWAKLSFIGIYDYNLSQEERSALHSATKSSPDFFSQQAGETTGVRPYVSTDEASDIEIDSAILNGTLLDLGGESEVDVYLEYGTDDSYGNTTSTQTLSDTGDFNDTIDGLSSETIYHYRAVVTDGTDTWYGGDASFKTKWSLESYKYRKKITIDSSKIDSELSHFPIPIPLGASVGMTDEDVTDIFDEVGSDYLKIAIAKADKETQLYVEVEQWDATNKKGLLWVSRDDWDIAADSDTVIYLGFDSTKDDNTDYVGDPGNRTEVWSSDFIAVFNFSETSGDAIDSTGNGHDGTVYGATQGEDGKIGLAYDFDGSDDYIKLPNEIDPDECVFCASFRSSDVTILQFIVNKYRDTSDGWGFRISGNGDVEIYDDSAGYDRDLLSQQVSNDTWHRAIACIQQNTNTQSLSLDGGAFQIEDSYSCHIDFSGTTFIGSRENTAQTFFGKMGQVCILNKKPSDDWAKADYYAVSDNLLTLEDDTIKTNEASNVTSASVTLNGTLISLMGESSLDVYFEYGTDDSYGNTTPVQTLSEIGSFSDDVPDLYPLQTYHYRAVVTDGTDTWYGSDVSFVASDLQRIEETQSDWEEGTLTDVTVIDDSLIISGDFAYVSPQSCSELSWDNDYNGYNNTCGESDPCSGLLTFEEALQYAYDQGGRLPTLDEVKNGAVEGTGCGYDYEMIWTCDKGNDDSEHWTTCGDHTDGDCNNDDDELLKNDEKAYVRFVADKELDRSDPVILEDSIIENFCNDKDIARYVYKDQGTRKTPQLNLSSLNKVNASLIKWDSIDPLAAWVEDFESNDLSDWVIHDNNFEIKTDNVYKGTYSVGINASYPGYEIADIEPFGGDEFKVNKFYFYWYETTDSTGGGLRLYDANGNHIVSFVSDNPEWFLEDGDGQDQIYSGDGYNRWVYVEFVFDWDSGTYDYYIEDLGNGHKESGTRNLGNSTGVSILKIRNFNSGNPDDQVDDNPDDSVNEGWAENTDMVMWFDNIIFEYETDTYTPTAIETRYSLDNGSTWSSWQVASNGGEIPDIKGSNVEDGLFECRQILESNDLKETPKLRSLELYFEAGSLVVSASDATDVEESSVQLNGSLDSLDGNSSLDVYFEYGTDVDLGNTTPVQTLSSTGDFNEIIDHSDGLLPDTKYYYKAIATDNDTLTEESGLWEFTTLAAILTDEATDVKTSKATLNGELTDLFGNSSVDVYFEYGSNDSYGNTTDVQTLSEVGAFQETLTELEDDSSFHFRAVLTDGTNTWYGEDKTFATNTIILETEEADPVTTRSGVIRGSFDTFGNNDELTAYFEYGDDDAYGNETDHQTLTSDLSFDELLDQIDTGDTIHFRAMLTDGYHVWTGADFSFTTNTITVATLDADRVMTYEARFRGEVDSLGGNDSLSADFEYGETTSYGDTISADDLTDASELFKRSIDNLSSGTTYHFRIIVTDGHNVWEGDDKSFETYVGTIKGTVREEGVFVERTVRLYRRDDGSLYAETTSSAEDGFFYFNVDIDAMFYVIALDNLDDDKDYNALIYDRIVP